MGATVVVQKAKEPEAIKITRSEDFVDRMKEAFEAISRRAFEIFDGNGRIQGHHFDDWFQAEKELLQPVQIEMTESDESITLKAEVPGFNEKELEVSIEPTRLTISGKHESSKEEKKGKTEYSETCSKEIFRVLQLPAEVDIAKATATLKEGALQLTMPKTANARTVLIQTQAAK
jgi:HSP20 family protein